MGVSIRDVARRLNLSITTVSRALDGYPDVSAVTRQEVIRVANEMGYSPNPAARQLRRHRADAIGYILPASSPRFNDPFFAEFVAGLGDQASRHNYDLLITTASPEEEQERLVYRRWVQGRRVDGIVLNRVRLKDWRAEFLLEMGLPFAGLESPDNLTASGRCGFVEVDSRGGFKRLVDHLVQRGHRRIAFIGGHPGLKIQAGRLEGYCLGLTGAGLQFDPSLVVNGQMSSQGGYSAALALLSLPQPPTAILCVNDTTAVGVLHAAHELGLEIGSELAVAGCDGIEETEHTLPPLTTLKLPLYEIACKLVEMLLELIAGREPPDQNRMVEPELIVRESTGKLS